MKPETSLASGEAADRAPLSQQPSASVQATQLPRAAHLPQHSAAVAASTKPLGRSPPLRSVPLRQADGAQRFAAARAAAAGVTTVAAAATAVTTARGGAGRVGLGGG